MCSSDVLRLTAAEWSHSEVNLAVAIALSCHLLIFCINIEEMSTRRQEVSK